MKYGMKRQHTINVQKYEAHVVGAWVEADEDDPEITGLDEEKISEVFEEKLDLLLAKPVEDAVRSADTDEADVSYVWKFYRIN